MPSIGVSRGDSKVVLIVMMMNASSGFRDIIIYQFTGRFLKVVHSENVIGKLRIFMT